MHKILSFYEFNTFDFLDVKENQKILLANCKELGIKGTIILSEEGINGTVSGNEQSIDKLSLLLSSLGYKANIKISFSESDAFKRLKVKIQSEIVTFDGLGKFASNTGDFIDPKDWDNFINNDDVQLVDVRNFYETVIGKFPNSIGSLSVGGLYDFAKISKSDLWSPVFKFPSLCRCDTGVGWNR